MSKVSNSEKNVEAAEAQAQATVQAVQNAKWDPLKYADAAPSSQCLQRLRREIAEICSGPPPGMFIIPCETDISKLHALITGPFDTPYEGGFFHFYIRCPSDYPMSPPMVKLMTTGGGKVRFNPNLYRDGKVCLSILGTWTGPAWSPASTITSVLMSIQSLMNDKPYFNEPGYDRELNPGDSQLYNDIIQHETIRAAVCEQLELPGTFMPPEFVSCIESSFTEYHDYYVSACQKYMCRDNQPMRDPFGELRGKFDYRSLLTRIERIQGRLNSSAKTNSSSAKPCSSSK